MIPTLQLLRPKSIDEAISLSADLGEDARYYAGGTELLLVLREGFLNATHLIDLKGIPELSGVHLDDDGSIVIGATSTHTDVERSDVLASQFGELTRLAADIANIRVRNTGTIGGNLCFAEPHGDPGTLLVAADAEVILAGPDGNRVAALDDWVLDAFDVDLRPSEVLACIRVPPIRAGTTFAYRRFRSLERPAISVAVRLDWASETVANARVVVGCAGPRPQRMTGAEAMLKSATHESLGDRAAEAAVAAASGLDTNSDAYGPEDFKRHMVEVFVRRAISAADGETVDPWASKGKNEASG